MKKKQNYISPLMEVGIIEMECGVAKGSAGVKPGGPGGIEEEWEVDTDDNTSVNWPS